MQSKVHSQHLYDKEKRAGCWDDVGGQWLRKIDTVSEVLAEKMAVMELL